MAVNSRLFLNLFIVTLVSGCSDKPSAPPSAQNSPPPPTAQRPSGGGPKQAAAPRTKPAESTESTKSTQVPWPKGVPPEKVFRAFPSPQGNFVIGPATGGPNPNDWFVSVLPESDSDSSAFLAIAPEWARERGAPSPEARLPAGFTPMEEFGYSNDGWPLRVRCNVDGAEMLYVPRGVFLQGMDDADPNAAPAHPADVDSFYIDRTEVTLGRYMQFLESGERPTGRPLEKPINVGSPKNQPALGVPWRDAQVYAQWAKKDLPTESEWELAARGPRSFVHPWGNGRAVWGYSREPGQIDPIGSFPQDRSVYGVLDMAGNAREWVADFYHENAYEMNLERDGSVIRNWTGPKRPSPANHKVIKGGGSHWQLWHRGSATMRAAEPDVSFRCVLRLSGDSKAGSTSADAEAEGPRRSSPRVPSF